MQPQQPNHPAPPDPTSAPPGTPEGVAHTPEVYTPPAYSPPAANTPSPTPTSDYGFILNAPPAKPKKSFNASQSMPMRLILVLGGLFVLLIMFVGLKNAFQGAGTNTASILVVIEDQAEIAHLAGLAILVPSASTQILNSAATTESAVNTAQTQLLGYLIKNHVKIKPTVLTLKISKSTDAELAQAATTGLYNQTYQSTMQSWFMTYLSDLQQAYTGNTSPKGRTILRADAKAVDLLQKQLNSPIS